MKPTRYPAILLALLMIAFGCGEPTAQEVLEKVQATYRDLETYRSEGTVVFEGSINGEETTQETSFRMLLKKPNLYLISWSGRHEGEAMEGVIWNDCTQAYFYKGVQSPDVDRKYYYKARDDGSAIASATGVSHGAASTIPPLFFPEFSAWGRWGVDYANGARIDRVEEVQGEECYVITGESAASKEETYWISKSRHFIVKHYYTYDQPEGAAPVPEIDVEMMAKMMGRDTSDERVLKVKKTIDEAEKLMKSTVIKGSWTETHEKRSTPKLEKAEFQFNPPKDAILKESVWDDIPAEGPERNPEDK
ncbi:MAG: hypothetical protein O7H41_10830 [Planctomycetota bacterium]|nr:hypothetical protein [Planctomycetota bacterium]